MVEVPTNCLTKSEEIMGDDTIMLVMLYGVWKHQQLLFNSDVQCVSQKIFSAHYWAKIEEC